MNLICEPWAYKEKKDNKYLLIWPDLPKWLVVDEELFMFLNLLKQQNSIELIIKKLSEKFKKNPLTIKDQINEILPILIKSKIVLEEKNKKPNKKDEFPIDKIEEVTITVTTRCNLNCKMCFNKYANVQKNDELTSEEIKDFLDQVIKLCSKDARVMISGGEPLITMNKTLEAAKYAKSLGFKVVSIVTNGTLVTKDFAKKVKELDIKIMVSLDGTNEKDHDFIRGKGVFKKTIRGIKILTEEGVKVQTNFMVHRGNINKLKEYYELAKDFDLYSARFISLKMLGGALETKDLELVPIDEILEKSYNLFIKYPEFRKYSGSNIFSTFAHNCKLAVKRGWCGTGRLMVVLDSDGAIYPCSCHAFPQFLAGNIRKEKFVDIWTKSTVLKKLRKIYNVDNINKKCSNCIVKHWCLGCKAEAYQVTKKLNSPDIQCKKMKKSIIWMMWKIFENPDLGKSTRSIETEYVTH